MMYSSSLLTIVFSFLLCNSELVQSFLVANLTTEYNPHPIGIDLRWNPRPRFAWQYSDGVQLGYHITVRLVDPMAGPTNPPVWDSGYMLSSQSTQILYSGNQSLQYVSEYQWTVQVTSTTNQTLTNVAYFGTGPDSQQWAHSAVWPGGATKIRSPNLLLVPTGSDVVRGRLYATGLGVYDVTINGVSPDPHRVLTPGWNTIPNMRVNADAYDVTELLTQQQHKTSKFVLGVRLGMGKYGYVGDYCVSDSFPPVSCYAFELQLHIWYRISERIVHSVTTTTSTTWLGATHPSITFDSFFNGETYNASLEEPGWNMPDFQPTHAWGPIKSIRTNTTQISTYDVPVRKQSVPRTATSIKQAGDRSWVFDFGTNMAGACTLKLPQPYPASAYGTSIWMVHTEILFPNGTVQNTYGASVPPRSCDSQTINCADQMDQFVFPINSTTGAQPVTYTPTFTFHGFRYVALYGWPQDGPTPNITTLQCYQFVSEIGIGGSVTFPATNPTSDILNKIQRGIVQTQLDNMLSHPSDCPQREKRGWMGDAQVSVGQVMYNFDSIAFYESWMRSFVDSVHIGCVNPTFVEGNDQRPPGYICCGNYTSFGCQAGLTPMNATGSLPDVVPYEKKSIGGWPGDWIWQAAGEVIPATLLRKYGNVEAQRLWYPMVRSHMDFVTQAISSTGNLLAWGYYGDWIAINPIDSLLVENMYLYLSYVHAAEIASALGYRADATAYTSMSAVVSSLIFKTFFNTTSGTWSSEMNANSMAYALGIGGQSAQPYSDKIIAAMTNDAIKRNYNPSCGLASCRWVLQGFTLANQSKSALLLASSQTMPSWGFMVKDNTMPGTIWETWDGDAFTATGSKNHPMFTGGIGQYFYESLLGGLFYFGFEKPTTSSSPTDCYQHTPGYAFDPQDRIGLTSEESQLACSLTSKFLQSSTTRSLNDIHTWVRAEMPQVPRPSVAHLEPRFVIAMPDTLTLMELGGVVSGSVHSPYGTAQIQWEAESKNSSGVVLRAYVPPGTRTQIAFPLGCILQEFSLRGVTQDVNNNQNNKNMIEIMELRKLNGQELVTNQYVSKKGVEKVQVLHGEHLFGDIQMLFVI
eukprot:PhF_6_TR43008/c0_g1_i1/m.65712/K05989/ramA; alpha-L-rhamnosidase